MNILLTGGTGFVGRHLVWRMCSEGAHVVFTGRNRSVAQGVLRQVDAMRAAAGPDSPAAHGLATFLELHHGAPGAREALLRASHGMDAIVHSAAYTSPWGRPEDFVSPNVTSTQEVIEACKSHGVPRMVHLSTPSLYFDYRDGVDIHESDPLPPPVTSYALTKATAERMVEESGLKEAVILRPRAIFGPWDNALLPRLIRAIERGPIPMTRGGQALLDLTYIDNLVDAILLAIKRPFADKSALPESELTGADAGALKIDQNADDGGGLTPLAGSSTPVYNISNGQPISVRDLFRAIAQEFGLRLRVLPLPYSLADSVARVTELMATSFSQREPRLTRYTLGVLSFSQTLNLDRARRELGYSPRVSVQEGIRRTARWWKAHTQNELKGTEALLEGGAGAEGQEEFSVRLQPQTVSRRAAERVQVRA